MATFGEGSRSGRYITGGIADACLLELVFEYANRFFGDNLFLWPAAMERAATEIRPL
jgi:hypothetical protein